jgi:hypothetical protein
MNQLRRRIQTAMQSGGGAAAFSPASIAGLQLWLDASQIAGLNDGDAVATWSDISGNANHATQATASKKPTYQTAEQNGLPGVLGDGVDDLLVCPGRVIPLSDFTVYAVLKAVTSGGGSYTKRALGNTDGGGSVGLCLLSGPQTGQDYWVLRGGSGGPDITMSGTIVFGTSYTYRLVMGAVQTEAFVNNTSRGTSTVTSVGSGNPLQLFCDGNSVLVSNVLIFEVLVYAGAHTVGQQAQVEAYLNAKWAAY